jgi:hypothetical protein
MMCPQCGQRIARDGAGKCPNCGMSYEARTSGLLKTSTVLISAANTDAVYHSVEDVPSPLRDLLVRSTSGLNSATILIADQGGKEQIAKAIRNLPVTAQRKLLPGFEDGPLGPWLEHTLLGYSVRQWAMGALGVLMLAAAIGICLFGGAGSGLR